MDDLALAERAWQLRHRDRDEAERLCTALADRFDGLATLARAATRATEAFLADMADQPDEALRLARSGLALLGDDESLWRARLYRTIGAILVFTGQLAEAGAAMQEQRRNARTAGDVDNEAGAVFNLAKCPGDLIPVERRLELLAEARVLFQSIGSDAGVRYVDGERCHALQQAGRPDEAVMIAHDLRRDADAAGDERALGSAHLQLAKLAVFHGDHDAARRERRRALECFEPHSRNWAEALIRLTDVQLAIGDHEELLASVEQVSASGIQQPQLLSDLLRAVARAHAALGEHEDAYAAMVWLDEHMRRLEHERVEMQLQVLSVDLMADKLERDAHRERVRREALEEHVDALQELNDRVREMSVRDPLTGLHNRRVLDTHAAAIMDQVLGGREAAVLMVDVDHFKQVNDTHGHEVGDEVLRRIAALLTDHVRPEDVLLRHGGEEFVVVLSDAPLETAQMVAERVRSTAAEAAWGELRAELAVTVSIGVAPIRPGDDVTSALKRADVACYRAKDRGRDLVHLA